MEIKQVAPTTMSAACDMVVGSRSEVISFSHVWFYGTKIAYEVVKDIFAAALDVTSYFP